MDLAKRKWENYWFIIMENRKHALLEAHFLSRKRQQYNSSFKTIIIMDQDPNTSTVILIHQAHVIPKLQFPVINLKWTHYCLFTHITTSILRTIPIMKPTLLMHINNTSYNMMNKRKYLIIWMITQLLNNNWKHSPRYLP